MADNVFSNTGRPKGYKLDRGGVPAESGPFIGEVMNNVDNIRSGRLQVYIEAFGGGDKYNKNLWRTVKYLPPFYGTTQKPASSGAGSFIGNPHSYGMWFTPPDIGVKVLCFFVEGDPTLGYYVGCIPDAGVNHMIPAIGSAPLGEYIPGNQAQATYLAESPAQPVTEINAKDNQVISDPRFFASPKPVHAVVAATMFQQGISNDIERGPITSSSQRESPSYVYGISTPGRPVYQSGAAPNKIRQDLLANKLTPLDVAVIARQGGHTFVMDDGDLENSSSHIRLRTSKGHQITMSDDGNFFYIIHANGQTFSILKCLSLSLKNSSIIAITYEVKNDSTIECKLYSPSVIEFTDLMPSTDTVKLYVSNDIKISSSTSTTATTTKSCKIKILKL